MTIVLVGSLLYDVHLKFLDLSTEDIQVPLCGTCFRDVKRGRRPQFNVGNGYDFGNVDDLEPLTAAEAAATATCIRFQSVVKFRGTDAQGLNVHVPKMLRIHSVAGVKGHVIHFEHTGKDEVAKTLPRVQLDGVLSVAFVGSKQTWSEKTATAQKRQNFLRRCPQTSINVEKVYRFLLLKKALDPAYRDVQIDVCSLLF